MASEQPRLYCKFVVGIEGQCQKEGTNDRCEEHREWRCIVCNKLATHSCDHMKNGIPCGALLCSSCTHDYRGDGHCTRESYFKKYDFLVGVSKTN